MIDIANHRFTDVAGRTREAYNDYNALMTDRARMQAGSALSGGDYRGAANALYGSGDVLTGLRVTESGQQRDAKAAELKRKQEDEAWKFTGEVAGNLMNALQAGASKEQLINAFDGFASRYEQLGVPADQVAATRDRLLSDPQGTLMALGAGAAKKLGFDTSVVGDELLVTNKDTGQVVGRYWGGRTLNVPQGGAVYQIPGGGGPMGDPSQSRTPDFNPQVEAERPPPNMGDVGPALSGRGASSMMDALIAQESGGNGNAVGPQTPYGQAQGSTQMLMETAEGVARKLGVPWNPSLMRGDTPNALAYQRQLGQAYLQEGLDKYGGDIRQALRYYHGGPNEALWGPKTNAYADAVMARMGQGGGALAGGAGSDTVQPSSAPQGARLLVSRPPAQDPMKELQAQNLQGQIAERQQKIDDAEQKRERSREAASIKAKTIISAVDGVLDNIGAGEAGFIGANMANVPGTKAYNVARQIETIKANLGFQELQDMRSMSPTGGALGAIAVQELIALQSTVANLDIGQSPAQLRANLQKVKAHYQRWLNAVEGKAPGGDDGGIPTVRTPDEARALPPGTRFRTPDGRVKVR